MRIVKTAFEVQGSSRTTENGVEVFTPIDRGSGYTDLLPSFNMRARLTDDVTLRLAANQTRTRPGFGQLNPGLSISPTPDSSGRRTVSGGSVDLQPIKSNNYDANLEYYFAEGVYPRDVRHEESLYMVGVRFNY